MMVKITWRRIIVAIALLATLGLTVAWLGIINIGASTGHWVITDKFLHWSMRSAVRTQSALSGAMDPTPPMDPTGVTSAAGHYAATCAFCHGAPGERLSPIMQAATPPAPELAATADEWSDGQLFWIVKHGVKFTAMPAWPAQKRDDEVRRMTAFVRQLPRMSPSRYRSLAYGPGGRITGGKAVTLQDAVPDCGRCHGEDGLGRGQPDIPILAGQKPDYLVKSLAAYASGKRPSGVMQVAAARIDPDLMRALAEHYAARRACHSKPRVQAAGGTPEDLLAARLSSQACRRQPAALLTLPRAGQARLSGAGRPEVGIFAARIWQWRGEEHVVEAQKPNETMSVIARRFRCR